MYSSNSRNRTNVRLRMITVTLSKQRQCDIVGEGLVRIASNADPGNQWSARVSICRAEYPSTLWLRCR
jgi:hypothetical protein